MAFLLSLAWRDLLASGRALWVFCASLALGVSLIAAGGSLYQLVAGGLQGQARAMFGGDLEVRHGAPLSTDERGWLADQGDVSLLIDLRTMLRTGDGQAQLIELQSADAAYPLYGELILTPTATLAQALSMHEGRWGAAVDRAMAQRLGVKVGDLVEVGDTTLVVRALVERQPDRSLRADWGAAPVLVSAGALQASGLIQPLSRVQYRYRVRTTQTPALVARSFDSSFPQSPARVRTFAERQDRIATVLDQIASGLLLVGFSSLFIGGLGVFNSVRSYLQGKLLTLATLRALGLRDAHLAALVLLQIVMMAVLASLVGVMAGAGLSLGGLALVGDRLPVSGPASLSWTQWLLPLVLALLLGVLAAVTFAMPALGRALSISPAALFRGTAGLTLRTPRLAWLLTAVSAALLLSTWMWFLPDARFGLAFVAVTLTLLAMMEGVAGLLRWGCRRLMAAPWFKAGFELRLALAGLQRPDSPLRASLLSLGVALTLLVACTLVLASLLRTVNETVPQHAPALVFHDVQTDQLPMLHQAMKGAISLTRVQTAPLVLGRLAGDHEQTSNQDDLKLSDLSGNIDDVVIEAGGWWPIGHRDPPQVAMENREAHRRGLKVGDQLHFVIMDQAVEAQLVAIYSQRRFQSRLWLEAIFSEGVLTPFVTRHVGAAYMDAGDAIAAQGRLAHVAPNVVSMRTQAMLSEVRAIMGQASAGLLVIAGVCLASSMLVLASVVAVSRSRQVYEATLMHTLGARMGSLRRTLSWEYTLLAMVTGAFAVLMGSMLAYALLRWTLKLDAPMGLYWTGMVTAFGVSGLSLACGARYLLMRLRVSPARLLRGD